MSKRIIITFIIAIFAIAAMILLTGCEKNKEENNTIVSNQTEEKETVTDEIDPRKEKMYGEIISNYENALAEYDLNDLEAEERIKEKYNLEDTTLLMHIARYSNDGVKLTKVFYDIDKNGIDELILCANTESAVIYSYDKKADKAVFIFALDTIERGYMTIYDNGIIYSGGAGGATLHCFEFGKISKDGTSYETLEKVEVEDKDTPEYRNPETGEILEYKSLDEVFAKYTSDAKIVSIFGN